MAADNNPTIPIDLNPQGVNDVSTPGTINIAADVENPPVAPSPATVAPNTIQPQDKKLKLPPPIISPTSHVPMFSPNGDLGDIPRERIHEAVAAGGVIGAPVIAPDGTHGVVPANRLHEAMRAGARIDDTGWTPDQLNAHPSIEDRLKHAVTGPGLLIDPNAQANSRNIELSKMSPAEAANEIHRAAAQPMINPRQAMTSEEQTANPMTAKALEFAGSMSSLENFAIMVGSGGLGSFPGPAGPIIQKALTAGFSLNAIYQAGQSSPKFLKALATGDEVAAKEELMNIVLNSAFAEQGAEHLTGIHPTLGLDKAASQIIDKSAGSLGEAIDKKSAAGKPTGPELAGKVTGATGAEREVAQRSLGAVDTTGVKTYTDLDKALDTKITQNTGTVDEALAKDTTLHTPAELEKRTPVEGGHDIVTQPVTTALDHLRDFYEKTENPEGIARIQQLQNKAETGLTVSEINAIAREHGNVLNAYNANGEIPASGLKKQAAENIRQAVKGIVRDLTPNEDTKTLDKQTSELIQTREMARDMNERVQKLQNKFEKAGLLDKAKSALATLANVITLGIPKEIVKQATAGASSEGRTLDYIELEKNLPKYLKLLDKVNATVDPAEALKTLQSGTENTENPTKATGASALGSQTKLDAGQDEEPEYKLPIQPALQIPGERLPKSHFSLDTLVHELAHATVAAAEGFTPLEIKSHLHPDVGPKTSAATEITYTGVKTGADGKMTVDSARQNIGGIMSTILAGAAADETFSGIPFDRNKGISSDIRTAKKVLDALGYPEEKWDSMIKAGFDRANSHLTQPKIGDTLKANAAVREEGLPDTQHISNQRMRGYVKEIQRIRNENADNRAAEGIEGLSGNAGRNVKSTGEIRESDDTGRKGRNPNSLESTTQHEVATAIRVPPELTTGEHDAAIKAGGAVPGGIQKGDPEIGVPDLALFHDPQTGSTLALKTDKVTAENVKKELEKSRDMYAAADAKKAERAAEEAVSDAKKASGGFVADLRTGKPTDTGFLVEMMPEKRVQLDHDATPKDIQNFYNANRQLFREHPELRIGGYKNELNISAHTENQSAAEKLASKLDQRSVWDVKRQEEIPIGGTGKQTEFETYPFEQRIKELRHAR